MSSVIRRLVCAALLCAACTAPSATVVPLAPAAARDRLVGRVQLVSAEPLPERDASATVTDLAQWELLGPFPDEVSLAAHERLSAAGKALAEEAHKRKATPTAALACAARELGHFIAEKRVRPPSLLRDFILGRCAVGEPTMASSWLEGEAPESLTDAEVVARWRPQLASAVAKLSAKSHVGAALERVGSRAVLTLVWAEAVGVLEPVPVLPGADGAVDLHGTAEEGTDQLNATVTVGAVGASACTDLHLRALPAYDVRCLTNPKDSTAWISVESRQGGRVLAKELARLLVWPSKKPARAWAMPKLVRDGIPPTVEAMAAELNALRTKEGLSPFELSHAQSADLHEVAPFYFQAGQIGDGLAADVIALGVVAGWRVEHEIVLGRFTSEVAEHADGSLLLTTALSSPSTRAALFDPKASFLAVGLFQDGDVVGALMSVYRGLEVPAFPQTVEALVQQLDAERAKAGRAPAKWLRLPNGAEVKLVEAVVKRDLSVEEALQHFLDASVAATQRGVQGFSMQAASLEELTWPPELISREDVQVVMVAAAVRAPKEPWGHVVVFVAAPAPELKAKVKVQHVRAPPKPLPLSPTEPQAAPARRKGK